MKHIFLCCDQTKPKCCSHEVGLESWEYLKRRIVELDLQAEVRRSKANCLQVCKNGPIMVIYPEGAWHEACTPEKIEEILISKLGESQIVTHDVTYTRTKTT